MTTEHIPGAGSDASAKESPYTIDHWTKLDTEVRWVTPQEAHSLRDCCHFDRQRNIRADHVRRLADEMRHAWFLAGTPIWLCVLPDKSMVVVNGNHTLEAVVESGVELPLTFVYQQVDSIDEAAQAYACFDIQRSRTWGQAAHAAGVDDGLPDAEKVLSALGLIHANFANGTHIDGMMSRTARFKLLEEYRSSILLIQAAIYGAPPSHKRLIKRSGVLAVAAVTARWQPSTATEFWSTLVQDDGLRATDPRKALLRYLQNHLAKGGNNGGQRNTQSLACASAWNAYFDNRDIEYVKPGLVFELRGTPWTRKGVIHTEPDTGRSSRISMGTRKDRRGADEVVTIYGKSDS